MRRIAQIPESYQKDGIKWLVIEEDKEDTGGVFLFSHKSLEEPSEYDSWCKGIEDAFTEAETQWGVKRREWLSEEEK